MLKERNINRDTADRKNERKKTNIKINKTVQNGKQKKDTERNERNKRKMSGKETKE